MTPQEKIVQKLDKLADLRGKVEKIQGKFEVDRSAAFAPVRDEVDAVESKYAPLLESANKRFEALRAEIIADVLGLEESVKGKFLHAVYVKGRVTWDSKSLDGFMAAHPEISVFRKQGNPGVTIREVASAE